MDIGPDSQQLALRDSVSDVLEAACPSNLIRDGLSNGEAWQQLWQTAVELGWTSLATRNIADDDAGLSTLDLALTMEACGAALAPIPMVTSVGLAAGALRAGAEQMWVVLEAIAEGRVHTLAAQRQHGRGADTPMHVSDNRIQGVAVNVPDADRAEAIVTLCRAGTPGEAFVAVVPVSRDVTITPTVSVDPSRPLATVQINAAPETIARVNLRAALTEPLITLAAELTGVAAAVLDLAVEHAKHRVQFGRPIGSFQGVKHALADNRVLVERARSLVYAAAAQLDDAAATVSQRYTIAALAKAAAGEAATQCARTAVQTLGALGQTWEHDAHLYLRRAWLGASLFGDSAALYHQEGQRFLRGES